MDLAHVHIPSWMGDIKAEAREKIISCNFAYSCRQGDTAVMRRLVIGLWPFVNEFPRSIISGVSRLREIGLGRNRVLLNAFLHRGPTALLGIQRDEENHRKLWIETGNALGLNYPLDYERRVLPETQAWIDNIDAKPEPSALFLRFASVEIIAETISVDLLASRAFTEALREKGCKWFRLHGAHGTQMSHERLELQLAFSLLEGKPSKETVNSIIQRVVDLFVTAADVAAGTVI